jgi:hypothetical protein
MDAIGSGCKKAIASQIPSPTIIEVVPEVLPRGIPIVQPVSESLYWLVDHPAFTLGIVTISIVTLVVSLWAAHRYLTTVPPDYFAYEHPRLDNLRHSHRVLRWTILFGKNLLGAILILLGLIMLFTPGQGVLTILLGIALVDIPGKRAIERRILRQPQVLYVVNRLRIGAGQKPLEF